FEAAKETGLKLIVGTEVRLADGPKLVVLAADHGGYSDICKLITIGRRRSAKGEYHLTRADAERLGAGACILWAPGPLHSGIGSRDSGFGNSTAPANRASKPRPSADVESGMSNPGSSPNPEPRIQDPGSLPDPDACAKWIMRHFSGRAWLAVELHRGP